MAPSRRFAAAVNDTQGADPLPPSVSATSCFTEGHTPPYLLLKLTDVLTDVITYVLTDV